MDIKIAASLMCADPLNLEDDIRLLEKGGIDLWHLDLMDGVFVPNLALNLDIAKAVKSVSRVPLDVHLMVVNPGNYVASCAAAGVDYLSFHTESTNSPIRLIEHIKEMGMKVGLAVNPSSGLDNLPYLIDRLDYVLIMTVEPGFSGQKFIQATLPKIKAVRELANKKNPRVEIQVDGNINSENAKKAQVLGANIFVAGTSSVFKRSDSLDRNLHIFKDALVS